jgi:hypothetical protein
VKKSFSTDTPVYDSCQGGAQYASGTVMTDITFGKMRTGFEVFAIGVFVWASIDYNRFIKFWMLRPAPYTRRVRLIFRLFFAACVLGGIWQIAEDVAKSGRPVVFYVTALPFTIAWSVVFFCMLNFVEWLNRKRRANSNRLT